MVPGKGGKSLCSCILNCNSQAAKATFLPQSQSFLANRDRGLEEEDVTFGS